MEVFGEPGRVLGNADKAVLDHRGLGMHAHDLVGGWLIPGHAITALPDRLLDQLGARSLVLDQHNIRAEQPLLLPDRALEVRIFEPPAQYGEEEEFLVLYTPGATHREIAELGRLVGGVPALHDAVEARRSFDGPDCRAVPRRKRFTRAYRADRKKIRFSFSDSLFLATAGKRTVSRWRAAVARIEHPRRRGNRRETPMNDAVDADTSPLRR